MVVARLASVVLQARNVTFVDFSDFSHVKIIACGCKSADLIEIGAKKRLESAAACLLFVPLLLLLHLVRSCHATHPRLSVQKESGRLNRFEQ